MKRKEKTTKTLVKVGKAIQLTKGGGGQITEYFVGGGIGRYS